MLRPLVVGWCVLGLSCAHSPGSPPGNDSKAVETEDAWIATKVAAHLLRLRTLAVQAPAVSVRDDGRRLTVSAEGRKTSLQVAPHVLAPKTWLPFVENLKLPKAERSPADPSCLLTLAELDPVSTEREGLRVSAALRKAAGDAGLHEQAAMVLAAMALQEEAGRFSDPREFLARMTAHLAFAQALRGNQAPSVEGAVATTVLELFAGRQREALKSLEAWKATEPMWAGALELLITRDPRHIALAPPASTLERMTRSLVRRHTAYPPHEEDLLEKQEQWALVLGRIVTADHDQIWEHIGERQLQLERASAAAVCALAMPQLAHSPEVLLDPVPDEAAFTVLPWSMWRDAFIRHLQTNAETLDASLRGSKHQVEAATARAKALDTLYGRLPTWPLVVAARALNWRRYDPKKPLQFDAAALAAMLVGSGFDLPPAVWNLATLCPELSIRDWPYQAQFPRGTVLDELHRTRAPMSREVEFSPTPSAAEVEALVQLAPFSRGVRWRLFTDSTARQPTVEELHVGFAPLDESDFYVVQLIAGAANPDEALKWHERACELNITGCRQFGSMLAEREDPRAGAVIERVWKHDSGGLWTLTMLRPLIAFYLESGQEPRAEAVARDAAKIQSWSGLECLAEYLERFERYDEAERQLRKIAEYYHDSHPLDAFYARVSWRTKGKRYRTQGRAALGRLMDGPFEKVRPGALSAAQTGFALTDLGPRNTRFGFRRGDVVLTVDGYRVRTVVQYTFVRSLSDAPETTVMVARAGRVVELTGPLTRVQYGRAARVSSARTGP